MLRQMTEEKEKNLSKYAQKSFNSKGRLVPEREDVNLTCYEVDLFRAIHSKCFKRLDDKTQVWIAPEKKPDHIRTRKSHTQEIATWSAFVARGLNLNETLTLTIAYLHDVGHTPFGHAGEDAIKSLGYHFEHNENSLRVVDKIENGGGLNLTFEVRDGILNHTGETPKPVTLEGQIVKILDKLYICHDFEDATRMEMVTINNVPKEYLQVLGPNPDAWRKTICIDMIKESFDQPEIKQSKEVKEAMFGLRDWMYKNVYLTGVNKDKAEKAQFIVKVLIEYYMKHPEAIPQKFQTVAHTESIEQAVIDYVAGMGDRYAQSIFESVYLPIPRGYL